MLFHYTWDHYIGVHLHLELIDYRAQRGPLQIVEKFELVEEGVGEWPSGLGWLAVEAGGDQGGILVEGEGDLGDVIYGMVRRRVPWYLTSPGSCF